MAQRLHVAAREQCIGCFSCLFACSRTWHRALTATKAALRVRGYAGTEGTFSLRTCRACADPDCTRACPTGALTQKASGALALDESKCTRCRACAEACLLDALPWDTERDLPLPCHQCGICVRYCPNGVLAMIPREEPHVDANA